MAWITEREATRPLRSTRPRIRAPRSPRCIVAGVTPAVTLTIINAGDAEARRPIAVESKRLVKRGAVLIREWHGTVRE